MSLLIHRYGQNGAYGDGAYKGDLYDYHPSVCRGLAFSEAAKCLHFGFTEEQGYGWAEDTGNIPWPESQGAVVEAFDNNGWSQLVIFDERSGLPYVINTFDGPSGSNYTKRYKDKVDPLVPNSGYDITVTIKQGEHYGEDREFILTNVEQRVDFRPISATNRGATGYDSTGLPTGFSVTASMYADAGLTAQTTIENVPLDREYVFDHEARGHTLQQELTVNKAEFRLTRIRSIYRVIDTPEIPSDGNTIEAAYQRELATPVLWLSRGTNLLLDRATQKLITSGAGTAVTGPDGKSNSALRITDAVNLSNSAQSNGTLMLWATSGYTIEGVTLTEYNHSGGWYLYYARGAIPASIVLPAGYIFDVRIYSSAISDGAIGDYYDDVIEHEGKNYLPRW